MAKFDSQLEKVADVSGDKTQIAAEWRRQEIKLHLFYSRELT
jgi:hypothetical protein